MTIKEFSHKHGLVFFWATIVLAVLLLITLICSSGIFRTYRYPNMMRQDRNIEYNRRNTNNNTQRPMVNGQSFQNRTGIIDNSQPQSTTSVNTSITNQ
jgi:hypothetical protein